MLVWRYNGFMEFKGRVLLINPWIHDFAAYNLWIEPLGMLTIAAVLRSNGYEVAVLDCLANHPCMPPSRPDGSGKFLKIIVHKPGPVVGIPRRFGRYGLPVPLFEATLAALPVPDVVMVASGMTYWYPGVFEAIAEVRRQFGEVPVAVGGVYASLCPDHARRHSGAETVIEGPGVIAALKLADQVLGQDSDPERYSDPRAWPAPAHELAPRSFAGISTSWGCPYHCSYCASRRLQPVFLHREPSTVVEEITACVQRGIRDFAFYDDALLLDAGRHLAPILEGVLAQNRAVRFHTPNGLHAGQITASLAALMRRAGFATVRLSLETTNVARQQATGGKVTTPAFEEAVIHLKRAGYGPGELGAYVLAGLPDQPLSEVEDTVHFVHDLGVEVKLALFSPIPGTPDGDRALPGSADPLLHNNTVYPYLLGEDYVRQLQRVKNLAKEGNAALVHAT
jgi:radical SAM superfamily enzyme YgiQ (UPF0313 family)